MSDKNKAEYTEIRRESIEYSHSPAIENMNHLVSALNDNAIVPESEKETTTCVLMALPKTVHIYILSFLGGTQEELRELPLVSKRFYQDCKEHLCVKVLLQQ